MAVGAILLVGCRIGFDPLGGDGLTGDAIVPPVVIDDFADGTLDPMWFPYEGPSGTQLDEINGELQFTIPNTATPTFAGVTTANTLDLTGKALWVELAAPPPSLDGAVSYITFAGAGGYLRIQRAFSDAAVVISDVEVTRVTTTISEMRWWRIREHAGEILFEIGPDGLTWTELHRVPAPSYTTAGGLNIGCGAFAQHAGIERWRIAGVGVAP
jgi:hypothetical protein